MTLPEALLWRDFRRAQLGGLLFCRQHPFGPSVLDFFYPEHGLAVEVDGSAHDGEPRAGRDVWRDSWLSGQGVRVLRVRAADVPSDAGRVGVLSTVAAAASPVLRTAP